MADKRLTVKSAADLLNFAEKLEQRDKQVYGAYMQKCSDIGMKKLVRSIHDGEDAHLDQIKEDREQHQLESVSVEPFTMTVPAVLLKSGAAGAGAAAFLKFAVEREAAVAGLYRQAAEELAGSPLETLFSTLADSEEKHRDWFQDRLELEELKG